MTQARSRNGWRCPSPGCARSPRPGRGHQGSLYALPWLLALAVGNPAAAAEFEVGSITLDRTIDSAPGNTAWQNVTLQASYAAPPVIIAGPVTHANDHSLSVRIRNVTATDFEIALTSPCDSADADPNAAGNACPPPAPGNSPPWSTETVRYLAVPTGVWQFPDGTLIEAASQVVSAVRSGVGSNSAGDSVAFQHSYPARPVVLHSVNTTNDASWITSSVFGPGNDTGSPPDTNGFTLALEGAEVTASHGSETVGWVAIEPASGTNDGHAYSAGVSAGLDTDRHADGCFAQGSFSGFAGAPDVVAGHNTMNGGNGGWTRFCGAGVETSQINIHIDEDQVGDGERTGIPEATSWFAFEADSIGLLTVSGGLDHYAIGHDGTAITCGEEAVTIAAHDSSGNAVDPGTATIGLSTSTGEGTWARVISGSGSLSDITAGDGAASYTFPGNGETAVTLAFNYTAVTVATDPETVNFDVDGGNEGAGEDPDLVIALSGFRISDGSGSARTVPEQIAGKPSDTAPGAVTLALQAVRASDSDPSLCEPFFAAGTDVDVELGGECNDPGTCAGQSLRVTNNGNTIALATTDDNAGTGAAGYTPVTLRFGANAEAPLVLAYDDAGRIQLHARYNPIDDGTATPPVVNYVIGSSNAYVVRPFGFEVGVAGDDATTGPGGTILAVAGDNVDTTVRSVAWQAGDDTDDDGQPDPGADLSDNGATPNFGNEATPETVTLAPVVAAPAGGSDGALSAALFSSFTAGAETHGVSWDEVGHVHIDANVTDGSYLGGSDATGRAETVGRFIPADFNLAVASDGDLDAACAATFTYTGQAAGYAAGMEPRLTITARNRAGGTTTNYRGTYAKLAASDVIVAGPTQDNSQIGLEGNPVGITSGIDTGALVANGDGTLSHTFADTDSFTYTKDNNARIDPFTPDVELEVTGVADSDGVNADPGVLPLTVAPAATHEIRFGRLAVDGAIGSELAPIDQAVRAEYWLNDTWQTHADDACTTLALASEVQLDNDQGGPVNGTQSIPVGGGSTDLTTNTADPVALGAGQADLRFAAPGDGNTGFVETTLTLTANRPWLRHDWDDTDGAGDGPFDDLPDGRVTFGIYSGNPSWIHFRRTE